MTRLISAPRATAQGTPRTISATLTAATASDTTQPIYLIRMAWSTELRVATWAADISWNSETWSSSGAEVVSLSAGVGLISLPAGNTEPWLSLCLNEGARGREITIYEYHTNLAASPQTSDAMAVFTGVMDGLTIDRSIQINLIESTGAKRFPATSVDRPVYNFLMPTGTRVNWGTHFLVAE